MGCVETLKLLRSYTWSSFVVLILPESRGRGRVLLLLQQVFGGSLGDDPASLVPAAGAEIDHVVAGPDEIEVVLDHQHGVALVRQARSTSTRRLTSARWRPVVGSSRI